MKVSLFDYGAGNLHSLGKALQAGGVQVQVTSDWNRALRAGAVVLPGVGSFGAAVRSLDGHREQIREALAGGLPCLGICLGMQLFFQESEEGEGEGIGVLDGKVRRLEGRIVPQMGWNDVELGKDPLFAELDELVAYYANSYVCRPENVREIIAWSDHEGSRFPAAIRRGSCVGVQFHPEKSSGPGLRLIRNFLAEARASSEGQRAEPEVGP
jgi:glutamine amidotransferase